MFRIIGPILSIAIALTVFFFFIEPTWSEIFKIQQNTNEYKEATAKASDFNKQLKILIDQQEAFSAFNLERLEALVPSEIDEVQSLIDIEALAKAHGLVFDNISVDLGGTDQVAPDGSIVVVAEGQEPTAPTLTALEGLERRTVKFTVRGSYEGFKAFLVDIERSLVLMEVVDIGFSAGEGDLIDFNMTIELIASPNLE